MSPCPYNLDDPCPDDQLRDQLLALQTAGRGYQQQIEHLEAQLAEARLDLGNWAAAAGNEKTRADRLQARIDKALEFHQPKVEPPWSLIDYTYCSCGAMESRYDRELGESITGPVRYPCQQRRILEGIE